MLEGLTPKTPYQDFQMKEGIHPSYNPVIFVDVSTGAEYITRSTAKSKETREIDGVTYYVVQMEVTADSHPFWTGKMHRLDTAGRIERFEKKFNGAVDTGKRKTRKVVQRKRPEE